MSDRRDRYIYEANYVLTRCLEKEESRAHQADQDLAVITEKRTKSKSIRRIRNIIGHTLAPVPPIRDHLLQEDKQIDLVLPHLKETMVKNIKQSKNEHILFKYSYFYWKINILNPF